MRSYDPKTGAVRWADQYDRNGGDDGASGVAIDGGRAFVAGGSEPAFGAPPDWLVRAYRAQP